MKNILLIGGTGFVGRALLSKLSHDNALFITVPTRHRERAKALTVLPTVQVIEADVHDPVVLAQLMSGQDAIINLVGVLHSTEGIPYGAEFARAHVELPQKIVAAARLAGIRRVLHVSALKASLDAPSAYLRSKAAGEAVVRAAGKLCGPQQYTLAELVRYASVTAGHPRRVWPLPDWLAWLQARVMEWLPNPPLTRDNLRSMQVDSVCAANTGLPFQRIATPLEAVAALYLGQSG